MRDLQKWIDQVNPASWAYSEMQGIPVEHSPKTKPRLVSSTDSVNPLDDTLRVSGNTTLTLETAVGCDGRRHTFVKTDSGTTLTIACTGSETINGDATVSLTTQYSGLEVISNGTGWDAIAIDSALARFIQSGTGAVTRTVESKLRDYVSAFDFMTAAQTADVKSNAATLDVTTALQAAIDSCVATGRPLYLPQGVYKITSSLSTAGSLKLQGAGDTSCIIYGVGMTASTWMLDFNAVAGNNVENARVSDINLQSDDGAPDGIRVNNVSYFTAQNVRISTTRDALTVQGTRCFSNFYNNLVCYATTRNGVYFNGHTGGGQHIFSDCTFTGDTGFVVDSTTATDNISFFGCNWEQCTTQSLLFNGSIVGLNFIGGRTEGCGGQDFLISPTDASSYVNSLVVHGMHLNGSDSGSVTRITLGGGSGDITGFQITGNTVTHGTDTYTAKMVTLTSASAGVISGNMIRGTTAGGAGVVNTTASGVAIFCNANLDGALAESGITATAITTAGESTDTTCFPVFVTAATGDLAPKSNSVLTFNSNTGALGASTLASTVATGTAPLTVSSTTKVSNLNVDSLDDQSGAYYLDSANFTGTNWTDLTDAGATTLHKHDHGGMDGLADDDHTQYTLAAGTRDFTGIVSYDVHPTFTVDEQIVDKKYVDDAITAGGGYTDEQAQDAVGAMVDTTLVYVDATPLLTRAALTGDVTAAQASNTTVIADNAVTYAKMQNVSTTDRLLGRSTASSGDVEEIVCTAFARSILDDADEATFKQTVNLEIGTDVQAWAAGLTDLAGLASGDGSIIVGDGANWITESGNTARTSLGLGTGNSPEFTAVNIGAATDTTITRTGAGDIAVEGNAIYRAGGTDVPLADGGTGASLADPGADRLMFWDDSAGAVTWLTAGTGLTITDTTITAAGGVATAVTVAGESADATCFPIFVTAATGDLGPKTNSGLSFASTTGTLTATAFAGPLTGNASTATALETARTIGGTSFNGTANIVPATITIAGESADATCFPIFVTAATGDLGPKTNSGLSFASTTGTLAASAFSGPLTGNVTGDVSGNAGTVTIAGESTDTTCFPIFVTAASGSLAPKTNSGVTFNSNTGAVALPSLTLTTDLALADGGTGASLADPGADRIMFWDESANAVTWLTAGSGLTITDTTITAAASSTFTVAGESADATCFPIFVTAATGDLSPKSNSGLTFASTTGTLTATAFSGPLTGNVTGNVTGNAGTVTIAGESADATCFPIFVTAATGSLGPKTNTGLTFASTTGMLTATGFTGPLTGNASTATALQTPRTIGGTSFDGTANIVPATITIAGESADATCFPIFVTAATGDLGPKTNSGLSFASTTGTLTATAFSGPLTGNVTGDVTGNVSGNAGTVTVAGESADTSCFPIFVTAASGSLAPKTNSLLTFNSSTGAFTFGGALNVATVIGTGGHQISSGGLTMDLITTAAATTANIQNWHQATTGDNLFMSLYTEGGGGSLRGSITYNRGGGVVAYNTSSGLARKNILGPAPRQNDRILAIAETFRTYEWKASPGVSQLGPIADYLREVMPDAVTEKDGELMYDKTAFGVPLVLAVADIEKRLRALEAR